MIAISLIIFSFMLGGSFITFFNSNNSGELRTIRLPSSLALS